MITKTSESLDYKKIILPMLLKDGVSDAEKLKNVNYFLGVSKKKSFLFNIVFIIM
jgi:hypothetical protein